MAASPSSQWEDEPCVKSRLRAFLLSCVSGRRVGLHRPCLWQYAIKRCFVRGGCKQEFSVFVCLSLTGLVFQAPRAVQRLTTEPPFNFIPFSQDLKQVPPWAVTVKSAANNTPLSLYVSLCYTHTGTHITDLHRKNYILKQSAITFMRSGDKKTIIW